MVSIIAAIAGNGAIGVNNGLLCRLPNDMKRFKRLTTGHTVIMGRKTFESLPHGALPYRTNVVITQNPQLSFHGCERYDNLPAALRHHQHENEIFIIGGASIYALALPLADKLYLTCVHHSFAIADVFFPEIMDDEWLLMENENFPSDEFHPFSYTFKTFIKKNVP